MTRHRSIDEERDEDGFIWVDASGLLNHRARAHHTQKRVHHHFFVCIIILSINKMIKDTVLLMGFLEIMT